MEADREAPVTTTTGAFSMKLTAEDEPAISRGGDLKLVPNFFERGV